MDDLGNAKFYLDSTRPEEVAAASKGEQQNFREKASMIGKIFQASMSTSGALHSNEIAPALSEKWSETAENVIFNTFTDTRIVVRSLDAVMARCLPEEPIAANQPWSRKGERRKPGIGVIEFTATYRIDRSAPRELGIVRIAESIVGSLIKPESRPDDGDPNNDPFLLHQRLAGFEVTGSGEVTFDANQGHVAKRTQALRSKTTTTTGNESKVVTSTLEILER
ncbi:MAG: hypothetical protein JNJ88_08425 [Planctomycetes bacterium]|nr:hypothetical protein [Planctomycetota bacterium]